MNHLLIAVAILLPVVCAPIIAQAGDGKQDTLFQASTLDDLLAGGYDGKARYDDVKRQGDFGLGTFAALDGEMVAVDGNFYQIRDDGIARPVSDGQLTPFAAVTFFKADDNFRIRGAMKCTELHESLLERFPSKRLLYAIKVTGRFKRLTTRSVPAQKKPYVPLAKALQQQVFFNFDDVDATLAGFWLPPVLAEINVTGFHFHAITGEATSGGHVLDCEVQDIEVEIDYTSELRVKFAASQPTNDPDSRSLEEVSQAR